MKLLLILLALLIGTTAYADDDDVIRTDTNSTVTSNGSMETTINSPPPSAISPNLTTGTGDLCTISASGSIQTQILGLSIGKVFTEDNCLRLKNAKTMYDMGMKVAAVSIMCEEETGVIRKAMSNAGTPCPYKSLIGDAAQIAYELDNKVAEEEEAQLIKDNEVWEAGAEGRAREERDILLLNDVDPIVSNALRWNDMTDAKRTEWTNYRQALLDVPAQEGFPDTITWPIKPE